MARVIVYHSSYGCETGCCGHTVELDDGTTKFEFSHPYSWPLTEEDEVKFAKELITRTFGAEHVADLDWANCNVVDD